MKARHHVQVALLTLAAFAVGLTWGRNWPAVIGLLIGSVMMTLIMGLLHSAKRDEWKAWHHREMDRERAESLQRGYDRGVDWRSRQHTGGDGDD